MTKKDPVKPTTESGKIFQRITPSYIPSTRTEKPWYKSDVVEDPLKKLDEDLAKKISISAKIKAAQAAGALTKEQAHEMKVQAGLEEEDDEDDEKEDSMEKMLPMLQLLKEAKTPEERTMIIQGMMGKKGGNSNLMLLASMMGNTPKEKSLVERYMEEKLMKDLSGEGKKSDMEQFKEFLTTFKDLQGLTGGGEKSGISQIAQEIKTAKDALTEMGLVQAPSGGVDEMKLNIELERLQMDKEIRLEEIKGKAANEAMIANAIKTGATALVTALPEILSGRVAGVKQTSTSTPPPEGRGITCINEDCKTFLPVKLKENYQFSCPKCNKQYLSQGDGSTVNEIITNQEKEGENGQEQTEENSS